MSTTFTDPDSSARRIDLFLALMRLDSGERMLELERIRREDPATGAALDDLLAHEAAARTEGFLELGATPIDEPMPGTFIGPYHLERCLGRGGMGIVYLAERREPYRQRVAIKRMRLGLPGYLAARFEAERQILATLDHPGIVRLLDGGSWPDGSPYYVMEYVAGARLDEHCRRHESKLEERVRLVHAAAEAVAHAHARGIVHRDLKPSNILVDEQGRPRVTDFGLAKLVSPAVGGDRTESNLLLGTPPYMAPERLTLGPGRNEPGVDVYSLGVVLFALVAKRLPFESSETFDGCAPILREDAPLLRRIDKSIPRDLETIVARALARDPRERFVDAGAMAEQLGRFLDGEPLTIQPPTLSDRLMKWAGRRRKPIVAWAASLTIMLLVTLGFLATWNQELRRDQAALRATMGAMWRASTRLFESLPRDNPAVLAFHGDLASSFEAARWQGLISDEPLLDRQGAVMLRQYGAAIEAAGKPAEALPLLNRSIELLRPLPARSADPGVRAWTEFDLFRSLTSRFSIHLTLGKLNDALADSLESLGLIKGLTEHFPDDPAWWEARGRHLINHAKLLRLLNRGEEAARIDIEALEAARRSVDLAGSDADSVKLTTLFWAIHAAVKQRPTPDELQGYLREGDDVAARLDRISDGPAVAEIRLVALSQIGLFLADHNRRREAIPYFERALKFAEELDPAWKSMPPTAAYIKQVTLTLRECRESISPSSGAPVPPPSNHR